MGRPMVRGAVVFASGLFAVTVLACDLLLGVNDGHFVEAGSDGPGPGVEGGADSANEQAAPDVAAGDDGADGSAPDASCERWCCVDAAASSFCDDFDNPLEQAPNTLWTSAVMDDGGFFSFSDAEVRSPPHSFLSMTNFSPSLAHAATMTKDIEGGVNFPSTFSFDFSIGDAGGGPDCVPSSSTDLQFIAETRLGVFGDSGDSQSFFVAVGFAHEVFGVEHGGVTSQIDLNPGALSQGWVRVEIDLTKVDGGVSATLVLTPPGPGDGTYPFGFQPVSDFTRPAVLIGARGKAACTVYYDNVTVYTQ